MTPAENDNIDQADMKKFTKVVERTFTVNAVWRFDEEEKNQENDMMRIFRGLIKCI